MKKITTETIFSLSAIGASLIFAVFILISLNFLPRRLPLFYSLTWGEEQLANPQQFLIIPSLIICIILVNLMFSWQLHKSQQFFKAALISASIVTSSLFLVTTIKIFLLFV